MALLDELFGIRSMQPPPSLDEAPDEILRRALRLNETYNVGPPALPLALLPSCR